MKCTFVVGDDSERVRRALKNLLESEHEWIVVVEPDDGKDPVEKVQTRRPDIVILNIGMPVMDGLQVAKLLRELAPTHALSCSLISLIPNPGTSRCLLVFTQMLQNFEPPCFSIALVNYSSPRPFAKQRLESGVHNLSSTCRHQIPTLRPG